jgi:hypothetical protein
MTAFGYIGLAGLAVAAALGASSLIKVSVGRVCVHSSKGAALPTETWAHFCPLLLLFCPQSRQSLKY